MRPKAAPVWFKFTIELLTMASEVGDFGSNAGAEFLVSSGEGACVLGFGEFLFRPLLGMKLFFLLYKSFKELTNTYALSVSPSASSASLSSRGASPSGGSSIGFKSLACGELNLDIKVLLW